MVKICDAGNKLYFFHCPGCGNAHGFSTEPGRWTFNNDYVRPTIQPSILCNSGDPKTRCHSFVENGNIRFLNDCHHVLKGLTVTLPDWDSY